MNPCVLLANLDILSYWLNVYACVLCVYYMYMYILYHIGYMCLSMYGMSISLHCPLQISWGGLCPLGMSGNVLCPSWDLHKGLQSALSPSFVLCYRKSPCPSGSLWKGQGLSKTSVKVCTLYWVLPFSYITEVSVL